MTLLQVHGLAKRYGGLLAAHNINFSVDGGELLALIGPNGAGKSTIFAMVGGQLRPDAGSIVLDGVDVTGLPPRAMSKHGVGRTFQVATAFTSMTVVENVQVAMAANRGMTRAIAEALNRPLAARGFHYGWVMVALAFVYSLFASAALGVPAVLIQPMSQELGWTIGELSGPQGLRFALFGLAAPFAGGLMLRYGPRRMLGIAGVLVLGGLLLTVVMTERWQMWLGMGVVLGLAPGLTALQLGAVISTRWFANRRGLVIGVMTSAVATGSIIFMPLAAWMAEHWGWRVALMPAAVGVLVGLVLFLLFAKDRPRDLGLPPLGEAVVQPLPALPSGNFVLLSLNGLTYGARRPVFWVLAFTFFICGVSSYGLTQTHFVPFCGDIGISIVTSATLLAIIGVCDLIGTIGSGWLSDRFDNRWLLAWYYGARGLSLFWLVYADVSLIGLTIFAVIYGLDFIATVPPTVRLSVGTFGPELGPVVFAWIFAAHQLGVGIMAFGTGLSRDALGTYMPAFLLAAVLCIAAATAFIFVRKPTPAAA